MARTQKYGIAFPIQVKRGKYLLDMNQTRADEVKSALVHLIFTPEGQKLRDPLFGTKLIKYLFEPDDQQTWDDVVMEIKDKVQRRINNCTIDEIIPNTSEDGLVLSITLKYSVVEADGEKHSYELTQTI